MFYLLPKQPVFDTNSQMNRFKTKRNLIIPLGLLSFPETKKTKKKLKKKLYQMFAFWTLPYALTVDKLYKDVHLDINVCI